MTEAPAETRADDARRQRTLKRRRRAIVLLLAVLLVMGIGLALVLGPLRGMIEDLSGGGDYEGKGNTEIQIEVPEGSTGQQVAELLVAEDVIKSEKPFLEALQAAEGSVQAGTFAMREQMSGAAAVDALLNPAAPTTLVVPEGFRLSQVEERMVANGFDAGEVDAALKKKPADYDAPAGFPNLEGLLYPATYEIRPNTSAEDMVTQMVDRTLQEFADLDIPDDEIVDVMTLASLVQVESPGDNAVRAKVARAFLNRTEDGSQTGGLLQSDATVAYIFGARSDLTTTAKERESDNPYNTYKFRGLPPGPINSPGRESVEAALNPAKGSWQFFVAVNPDTGETRFADTYAEHQKNVELYRAWLREHRASATPAP